jgi:hypothetical protein
MQLLILRLDVRLVKRIVKNVGKVSPQSLFKDCIIPAEGWEKDPRDALAVLQLLVAEHAPLDNKVESQNRTAMTPLAHAVAGGSLEGVKLLLEHNADPESAVYEPHQAEIPIPVAHTALGWAAKEGRVDLCQLLIGAGAITWRTGALNQPPLYWASRYGHLEVVEDLLSLDTKRSSIDECLIAAIESNEPKVVKLLLDTSAGIDSNTVSQLYPDSSTVEPDKRQWEAAMKCQPKPRERSKHLEIIDLLKSNPRWQRIKAEAIACAINSGNFAGLSRVLDNWDNEWSAAKYYSGAHRIRRGPGRGREITCVDYAKHKGAMDFVELLKNYRWHKEQLHWGL